MKLPRYTKLRGNIFWFQMGVPVALQAYYRVKIIQETLSTTDRTVAAHMALERAVHWKREFRLQANSGTTHAPRAVYQETVRKVEWIVDNYRDPDARDMQLDVLWDGIADKEAIRLGYLDISEAPPELSNGVQN
ncbi:MAG: hypothetical protein P0Y66_10935 [Candidatus Kaistia colombiensis]|nr:MAG: hypothetical protein P0Y66_10935 [Kaistia sp.]